MTLFYIPYVIYNTHLWYMAKMQKEEGWKLRAGNTSSYV